MSITSITNKNPHHSWRETFLSFIHPRVITMLFLGFSAGLPYMLIFSSLSLWLGEAGVSRDVITYFSWAALGYSFKFVWAPIIDKLPLPWLKNKLGQRRSWLLLAQLAVISAILWMALTNPAEQSGNLTIMAIAAVFLGFSSATQDIVIDAYRIESAESDLQAMMSSAYTMGYRIGMWIATAGVLLLATYLGSSKGNYLYQAWQWTYFLMAGLMSIGVATTLIISEPTTQRHNGSVRTAEDYLRFLLLFVLSVASFITIYYFSADISTTVKNSLTELLSNKHLAGFIVESTRLLIALFASWITALTLVRTKIANRTMLDETYINPIKDFFQRYGITLAWMLLALIGLYRISDIVLGVIANVFYQDMGFTKPEIATAVKTFGIAMTIVGSVIGGIMSMRYGVMRILFLGALLSALTNLLFMLLASNGHDIVMLYIVIAADNLSAGIATAAFIAFLSSLTNISFTAMQYAIFSSLMTLIPKVFGGYSGSIASDIGYSNFFMSTAIMGIPVLLLIIVAGKHFENHNNKATS